ncbi:MAG: IS5 family transposase [bacterium]
MQEEYIKDEAWGKMLKFFRAHSRIYIKCEKTLKRFIESIYWIIKSGAPWRMLPEKYGKWNSIYKRFRNWVKKKVWEKLMDYCVQEPDLEYVIIDATIVRAHACAAGYGIQTEQGLGRSKGGFTSKIHVKVDALGNPLKFIVTPGQKHEVTQAEKLLGKVWGTYVLADRGYDSDDFRACVKKQGSIPVIPGKCNRKKKVDYDKHIYKERSLAECFFSKIKHFRRVFSRFDKSVESFIACLSFAGAILWLR